MTKLTAVLDTNVYLSGIIFGGNCRHILDLAIAGKISAVSSPEILLEISQKLAKKFLWSQDQVLAAVKTIIKTVKIVKPKLNLQVVKADQNDNKIIEAAIEAKAKYIVSGDNHLLKIKKYKQVKIVTPQEFLSIYLKKNDQV